MRKKVSEIEVYITCLDPAWIVVFTELARDSDCSGEAKIHCIHSDNKLFNLL